MEKEITYYLICDKQIGKREGDMKEHSDFLLEGGKWVPDEDSVIMDRLVGFDPTEPEGSPFRTVSSDMLEEIKEIDPEEAVKLINKQILDTLRERWKNGFKEQREKWGEEVMWPAKMVGTVFELNGIKYVISSEDLGLSHNGWDQGFMEYVQDDIGRDLEEFGATNIKHEGMID